VNKELEIWQFAADKLKQNESVALLIVAQSSGSSPGRQGYKMAVAKDDLVGSVGGGVMEVRLAELAKERKKIKGASESAIVEQIHRKNSPNKSGMICSGKQTIVLRRLDSSDLKTVRGIIDALENHCPQTLHVSNSRFEISNHRADFDFNFEQSGENDFLYQEKLGFKNRLFIVGGGHCALALSELMSKMDFYITLFDDRPNLNTLSKNEFVHRKQIIESYKQIGEFIPPGANHFVVVMTLGYASDEIVIRELLDKKFKYFGALGSPGKMKTLLKQLKKDGFPEEKLNRLRTPIGLPINSRTPEEIAVSIAAEIIRVKNTAR